MMSAESIRVCIRVRNFLQREEKSSSSWKWDSKSSQIWNCSQPERKFAFDNLVTPKENNSDLYNGLVLPTINQVVAGFNATVFAYGQTSSGKTHTMLGNPADPGVIPRSIDDIFNHIHSASPEKQFLVRISYMEIYNENLTDLLVEPKLRKKLNIMEDTEGNVNIDGLNEVPVENVEDIKELMSFGESHRHYGETNMNERSSRSHTIFRLIFESSAIESTAECGSDVESDEESNGTCITVSHLNIVDLAGSERANQTGAVGDRLREGANINKSLMLLGQVISKLSEGAADHIPFRGSKLTRILKNSLGGNAKTTIICTISPAEVEQTKSTLEFASRAKKIVQHAKKNEILDDKAHLARMQKEIQSLKEDLKAKEEAKEEIIQLRVADVEKDRLLKDLQEKLLAAKLVIQQNPVSSSKSAFEGKAKRRMSWHPSMISKRQSMGPYKPTPLDESVKKRLEQINAEFMQDEQEEEAALSSGIVSKLPNPLNNESFLTCDTSLISEIDRSSRSSAPSVMDDGQSFLSPLGRNQNSPDSSILGPESLAAADHISPFDFHPPSMVTTKRRGSKKRGVRFDEKLQTPSPSLRRSVQISRLSSSVAMGMSPMVDALDLNGTPKSVIRSKLLAKEAELEELKEFTKLEQECKNEEVEWQKEAQKMKWENSVLEKKVAALTESKNKLEQDIKFFQTENEGFWKEKYEGDKEERKQDAKQLQNEEKCKQVHIELENALEVTNGLREMVFKLRNELQDQESQEKEFKEKTECINAELILKLQHMNEKCTEKEDLLTRKNEIIESLRDQLLKSSEQINESVKLTEDIKKEKEVLAHEKSEVVSELLEAKTCIQKLSTDLEKANLEKDETYQKLLDQESRAKVLLKDYESLLSNTQECTTQNQKSHELQIQEQIKLINEEHNLKWKEMSKKSIEMEEKLSEKNEIIENLRNQLGDSKKETEENVKLIEEVKSNNRALTSTNEILANEKSGLFTELLESKTCITRLSFDLEKAKVDKDKINLDLLAQESKAEALLKDYESLLSSTQDCTVRNQMSHELELQKEIKSITEEHALKFKEMTKKTNEMEKKIKEKSEIIESLSDQLLNFRKQLDDNFKFTEEMKNSNTVLASENDKLVDEKSGFTSELLEAKTCITKLSSDLDKANKEKDETHQKLLDQESRAEALLKGYENFLSNTQDTTVQNQRSLELEFQEKIKLMNEEHDLKCLEMSKLNTEMEEKLREQSEALEKLKGQLQNETTQQSSKIEEILREKNEIIENLRAQHSHFLQNEDSNKEFQEKLDSIHAELDMKGQELASKTTELKNKLMEKENVIVTLQSQLQVSSEKLEERVKLTEKITNNNRVLASEKEVIGNEKSALAAELLEAQARISRLTSDLEIANVEKEETYQKLLAQDANAEKLLKDYTSLVMDTRDYSQKIEDLNKECDKLRDFEDKYQEACDALELLKETIVSQSRHKEESEDDAGERKSLDLLKEEILALASENETLKKSLEEKEEELDELESVYKDKEAEEQLSEERILNFQKKVQELIKEKDALVLDKEALQNILDKKEQELKSTKSNSGGVDSQQQLTIAETELKKMTQKLNQTYDQVERLRENCASLQAEKEKLQKNMLSVQDALNEKSVELETYFEVFDEMKKDKEDLEQRCDTLTKQMTERSQQVPASTDGSQTELKALLEKHHKTLVELAAIKVEVQREEGEFKKKCKTLANDLQFEKDAVRNLKDKMRRIQSERFDSTIMPPLSKPNSFQDLSNSKSLSNKATSTDSLLRAVPASPRKNAAETYAQEMARFEKANWSTGSGTVKNFALETAQLRVKELTYENEDLRKEKEHYYQTAFKWKGEAKMAQKQLKEWERKVVSQKEPPIGAASLPVPKLDVLKEVPPSESNQLNRSEKKRFGSLHKKKSKVKMEPENTKGEEDDDFGDFDLFKPKEDLSQFRPGGSEYRSAEAGQMKKAMATPSSKNTMTPGGKTPRKKRMMPTPSKENCKQQ